MLCFRPNSEVYYGIVLTSFGDIGMDRKTARVILFL